MVPRVALVSCELRAALVRSGQAGAPQRGQGDGRKVVRTGGFDDEGIYTKVLKWNLLEFTRIYFFGGDYTDSQSWAWGGMRSITLGLFLAGTQKRHILIFGHFQVKGV